MTTPPDKLLIGMIHLQALPGSPAARYPVSEIARSAAEEARALADAGFDALIVENMHDRPYLHGPKGPEVVAAMTRAALAVREAAPDLPLGIQVLSGGNREALAIAHVAAAAGPAPEFYRGGFIRCENFVFAHIADEGLLPEAEAGPLLRERRRLGADGEDGVRIFADIKKKHASHAITADVSLAETAAAAEFFGVDGLIVTGRSTGLPTSVEDVAAVAEATELPVFVGSGVTPETIAPLLEHADGLIVGSWIKRFGRWENPIDPERCARLAEAFRRAGDG